jgi:hypothetical protein
MGIANSFITNAAVPMELSLTGRSQDISKINTELNQLGMIGDINTSTFGAQSQYATNLYNAATGQAMTAYDVAQQNAAADLARGQAQAQMVTDSSAALGSAITAGYGAYNQYATAANASTTPMSSGFYQGQVGAANAYNVAPSQLSYQAPSGGFMGIGGQGGGYYYTPSGVYGR